MRVAAAYRWLQLCQLLLNLHNSYGIQLGEDEEWAPNAKSSTTGVRRLRQPLGGEQHTVCCAASCSLVTAGATLEVLTWGLGSNVAEYTKQPIPQATGGVYCRTCNCRYPAGGRRSACLIAAQQLLAKAGAPSALHGFQMMPIPNSHSRGGAEGCMQSPTHLPLPTFQAS